VQAAGTPGEVNLPCHSLLVGSIPSLQCLLPGGVRRAVAQAGYCMARAGAAPRLDHIEVGEIQVEPVRRSMGSRMKRRFSSVVGANGSPQAGPGDRCLCRRRTASAGRLPEVRPWFCSALANQGTSRPLPPGLQRGLPVFGACSAGLAVAVGCVNHRGEVGLSRWARCGSATRFRSR